LFAVVGSHLLRLDTATLAVLDTLYDLRNASGTVKLVECADGSGLPGIFLPGWQQLILAGQDVYVFNDTIPPPQRALLAWDAEPESLIQSLLPGPALTTAILLEPWWALLYHGANRIGRISCQNVGLRPIQFGPDPGLELAFQLPGGGWKIYSQAGTLLAEFPLEDGHAAPLTGSRSDAGGLALLSSSEDRLSGLDGSGEAPPTWPRVLPELVDGPVALPELGWVLGVGRDGRVEAWEAALEGPVWTQPRGDANGGHRPTSSGLTHARPVRQVRENQAFIWPNPAVELAHLRFWLDGPARVKATICDTAGDVVARLEGSYDRAGEQELLWHSADVAPGAYFCLLEAEGAGDTWTRRVKCAVLR
jgi:hypothetical protein